MIGNAGEGKQFLSRVAFLKGVAVTLLNPQAVPYWILAIAVLLGMNPLTAVRSHSLAAWS